MECGESISKACEMPDAVLVQKPAEFYIRADPSRCCVEAWARRQRGSQRQQDSSYYLPFKPLNKLSPAQRCYRDHLCQFIANVAADGRIRATYVSELARDNSDLENFLFFNLQCSTSFENAATQLLRFERICEPPPKLPQSLDFEPFHYVKYARESKEKIFQYVVNEQLAHLHPMIISNSKEFKKEVNNKPMLWWLFKQNLVLVSEAALKRNESFAVCLQLSAPKNLSLNLAHKDIVKPLMDIFISALHCYVGEQLDEVSNLIHKKIREKIGEPVQNVCKLLCENRNALLGPHRVPHLWRSRRSHSGRGSGLQWSPADHRLMAGEIRREISVDDQVRIAGSVFAVSQQGAARAVPEVGAV